MAIEFTSVASFLVWIFVIVSIADLVCGLVHWWEDSYGQEHWPLIGSAIIAPNRLHHVKPRVFIYNNWWQSARFQVVVCVALVFFAQWAGWFSWKLLLFVVVATNGNEVHKWAHRTREENGRLISWLQARGVVQTCRQHARHHSGLRNTNYCTITTWVNPVVDGLGLWRLLEFCIVRIAGVKPVCFTRAENEADRTGA
jgi:hypothetical protein